MRPNPFSVGALRPANYMFGRDEQINNIQRVVHEVENGHKPAPLCFSGAPGAGKTSMLKYAQKALQQKNWLCGYSEASPDTSAAIDDFLGDVSRALPKGRVAEKFSSRLTEINVSAAGVGAGIKLGDAAERTTYARVRELFTILGDVAKKSGVGVALLLDEAQVLPRRYLKLLFRTIGSLDDSPVCLIAAGLPAVSGIIYGVGDDDEISGQLVLFPPDLSPLSQTDSRRALATPIRAAGGFIWERQVDYMASFAEGHPLTLRMLGREAWELADRDSANTSPLPIEAVHVEKAIAATHRQLRIAYYDPMWRKSNEAQRKVMISLASAQREGKGFDFYTIANSSTGDSLFELFDRGVISNEDRDELKFTIPGFGKYVLDMGR